MRAPLLHVFMLSSASDFLLFPSNSAYLHCAADWATFSWRAQIVFLPDVVIIQTLLSFFFFMPSKFWQSSFRFRALEVLIVFSPFDRWEILPSFLLLSLTPFFLFPTPRRTQVFFSPLRRSDKFEVLLRIGHIVGSPSVPSWPPLFALAFRDRPPLPERNFFCIRSNQPFLSLLLPNVACILPRSFSSPLPTHFHVTHQASPF